MFEAATLVASGRIFVNISDRDVVAARFVCAGSFHASGCTERRLFVTSSCTPADSQPTTANRAGASASAAAKAAERGRR